MPVKYRGGGPPAIGGYRARLSGDVLKIAQEIANDELNQCASLLFDPSPPKPTTSAAAAAADAAWPLTGCCQQPQIVLTSIGTSESQARLHDGNQVRAQQLTKGFKQILRLHAASSSFAPPLVISRWLSL